MSARTDRAAPLAHHLRGCPLGPTTQHRDARRLAASDRHGGSCCWPASSCVIRQQWLVVYHKAAVAQDCVTARNKTHVLNIISHVITLHLLESSSCVCVCVRVCLCVCVLCFCATARERLVIRVLSPKSSVSMAPKRATLIRFNASMSTLTSDPLQHLTHSTPSNLWHTRNACVTSAHAPGRVRHGMNASRET